MTVKWNKKMAVEAIVTLTSPFDKLKQGGQKPSNLAEMIKQMAERNAGVRVK